MLLSAKTKVNIYLLLKILLSALFFNIAFYFTQTLGFFIIFAFILLYNFYDKLNLKKGFFCGFLIYGLHTVWLFRLLSTKSELNIYLSFLVYLAFSLYFALITAIFFKVNNLIFLKLINIIENKSFLRFLFFLNFLIFYFYFILTKSLFFMGRCEGYIFINPLIPLAKYKIFILLYSFICDSNYQKIDDNYFEKLDTKVFFIKPINCFDPKYFNNYNSETVGQDIYHKINELNLFDYSKNYKNLIIFAPETTYPYALNNHKKDLTLWSFGLPCNAHFIFGSQRKLANNYFQTIFWVNQNKILNYYDKTHRVFFVEYIPKIYRKFKFLYDAFLYERITFCKGHNCTYQQTFNFFDKFGNCFKIVPAVCSELFFKNKNKIFWKNLVNQKYQDNRTKKTILAFFVNDSWFEPYFKNILKNLTILRSIELGLPILYINH